MTAYYNENDKYAAEWLRNLIKEGLIADGVVDDRSIEDVAPRDLSGFTQCHFFAGIGVWSYALRLAGWPDDRPVWTGSCPCQPFSAAGKGKGFADERHLWPAWFWLISQSCPDTIFGEQAATPNGDRWFDLVRSDLEAKAYAVGVSEKCAAGFASPHERARNYFVADANIQRQHRQYALLQRGQPVKNRLEIARSSESTFTGSDARWETGADGKRRWVEPGIEPLAHGAPARVGRLRAYGNAINVQAAVEFIRAFAGGA